MAKQGKQAKQGKRTKQGKKARRGLGLGFSIFLVIALLIVLLAGGIAALSWQQGQSNVQEQVNQDLDGSFSVQTVLRQLRHRQLELISRIFSTDQLLTEYLSAAAEKRDTEEVFGVAEEYQNLLSFNLGVVLDAEGMVLARTDDPAATGADLSDQTQITVARDENQAFGVWSEEAKLYHAVTVPLVRNFDRVGYLLVAFAIDDALALQLTRITGAETVFLANTGTGPTVAASTLAPALAEELIASLRLRGELLNRLLSRGERITEERFELQGQPWAVRLAPLADAAGQPVGAVVSLSSLAGKVMPFKIISGIALALGLGALILGFLLAQIIGRGFAKPVRQLSAAIEDINRGNAEAVIPEVGSGEFKSLADGIRFLLNQWRGKQALEFFASGLARYLPEPPKASQAGRPQAVKATLSAVELRRFANPKTGYDAEESLGRLGRDLRRIAASAEARKGRIAAMAGHQVLMLFDGEGASHRALLATCEVLLSLSERENVFDEPDPPAVAMTEGNVVIGSLMQGGRTFSSVAGLPVQQLESLLREATPGEIFLSKQICLELVDPLRQAGVQLRAQRGLVSPQPIYVLGAEQAKALAGPDPTSSSTQVGFPGEGKSLSEVAAGVVLGNRFEILAELGAGLQGVVFKAQDRQQNDLVTLKMLKPEILVDAVRFERLKQAIQRLRGLDQPNLLRVLDFGEVERLPYISMEFVRAMNLRHVLEHSSWLPIMAGFRIAQQISGALAAAHQQGIVHGGLKPENVLVEARGNTRLMDFALAPTVRATGGFGASVAGVPYLAPEQLEGQQADSRSDIYACGAVLYELLTRKLPYAGAQPSEVQFNMMQGEVAPPSSLNNEIPAALEQILLRCLAKNPEQRYAHGGELLDALDELA